MFCEKQANGNYKFNNEYSTQIEFTYEELTSRMLRSYNSFNREIEFILNLMDKSTKFDIEYDLCRDLFDGIDLTIAYQNKIYGIAEYVDTGRSKAFKNKKNTTRHDYSNFEMIDVTAKMSGDECNVVEYGDIYCYDNQVVYDLENDIKSRDCKIKDEFER